MYTTLPVRGTKTYCCENWRADADGREVRRGWGLRIETEKRGKDIKEYEKALNAIEQDLVIKDGLTLIGIVSLLECDDQSEKALSSMSSPLIFFWALYYNSLKELCKSTICKDDNIEELINQIRNDIKLLSKNLIKT